MKITSYCRGEIDCPAIRKLPLVAVLIGTLLSTPSAALAQQAPLTIESASATEAPIAGTAFELDIVGDGFDPDTRVILHLDSGNRSSLQAGLPMPSVAREVHVVGDLAYVLSNGVVIVDISNADNPVQLGFYSGFSSGGETLDIRDNIVYAVDNSFVRAINVSDPTSPFLIGGVSLPDNASRMQIVGDLAYVATYSGLHVLDLSDAANPTLIGSSESIDALDLVVMGNTVICAVRSGLVTIDVSDPTAPVILGSFTVSGETFGVSVSGSTAYVVNTFNGFLAIDISNPGTPVQIGELPMSSSSVRLESVGDRSYVAGGDSGIHIVDTQDPANPVLIGRISTPGRSTHLDVEGTTAYVADWETGLQIVDVGNPSPSQLLGGLDVGLADSIEIEGSVAYLSLPRSVWGPGGLRTVNISDAAHPALIGSAATDSADVVVAGDIAYLAGNNSAGLLVIGGVTGTAPSVVGSIDVGRTTAVDWVSDRVYAAGGGDFHVIDASTPETPVLLGTLVDHGGSTIQVVGDYAFVGRGFSGYSIVDISDDANPTLAFAGTTRAHGLTVDASIAVAVGFNGAVQTLDVADPTAPVVLGAAAIPYATYQNPYRAAIVDDLVYVGDYYGEVYVVDISTPATPMLLATLDTPGFARGLKIIGQRMYVADDFMGLTVLPTPLVDPVFSVVNAMHLQVSVPALEVAGSYSVKVIRGGESDIIHGAFSVGLDTDGDGVPDDADAFPNDPTETIDTDGDGIGNNADVDDDGDGMSDDFEAANGFDALDPADAEADADGDGFTNLQEFQAGTDPQDAADFPAVNTAPAAIFILLGTDEDQ